MILAVIIQKQIKQLCQTTLQGGLFHTERPEAWMLYGSITAVCGLVHRRPARGLNEAESFDLGASSNWEPQLMDG